MQLEKIRMTLTGPYKGKTIVLNKRQFVNGECIVVDQPINIGKIVNYFTKSYQVEWSNVTEEVTKTEAGEEATREDDDVVDPEEDDYDHQDGDPNSRQQDIIAAINGIDREDWIEKDTNPHPRVKDVATLMEDPTVTKEEICEVVEKWLS